MEPIVLRSRRVVLIKSVDIDKQFRGETWFLLSGNGRTRLSERVETWNVRHDGTFLELSRIRDRDGDGPHSMHLGSRNRERRNEYRWQRCTAAMVEHGMMKCKMQLSYRVASSCISFTGNAGSLSVKIRLSREIGESPHCTGQLQPEVKSLH